MAVVPDRRKDCTKRLEMLKTNKMITIDALTHLVEQHDGRTSKHIDKDDKAIEQLEIDVTRVLKERKLKKTVLKVMIIYLSIPIYISALKIFLNLRYDSI